MKVLVINAGSSSIKYQLIDMDTTDVLAKGNCSRIGLDGLFEHKTQDGRKLEKNIAMPDHGAAIKVVLETLTSGDYAVLQSMDEIYAVGHRIVHGGEKFKEAMLVTDDVIRGIEEVTPLAPLHNPGSVTGIKACRKEMPNIPHVVVFDTAFHQTMPRKAYLYAVPYEFYEKYAVRRYGFHGTSHRYLSERLAELMGKDKSEIKAITCHLGNGSSITAIDGGKCVDTSMGFTPLAGIPMGTRTGTIDPSVVTYLMEKENMTAAEMSVFMNKKCGFLGLSGISSDSRDIEDAAQAGDERAIRTQEVVRYEIVKYIGGYVAAMGGLDALVFSAGIGENNPNLRANVCRQLAYFGVKIDEAKNDTIIHGKEAEITAPGARVRTFVIPTNEEYMIAKDTLAVIAKAGK